MGRGIIRSSLIVSGSYGDDTLIGGDGDDSLIGGDGADWLYGGDGRDFLNGGFGADVMVGGTGNDVYYVDDAGDVVVESADPSGGYDSIVALANYTLLGGVGVEELSAIYGNYNINLTGNNDANILWGNDGRNILVGGAGGDTMRGGRGDDTLDGGTGDDALDGGIGADKLIGGAGNDVYYVDNAGDLVIEAADPSGGYDTVRTTVDYTLVGGQGVEALAAAAGSADIDLRGNEFANVLWGNDGRNILLGGDGNDTLNGGRGGDRLVGGFGNDSLDGGTDADTLGGGDGNDTIVAGDGYDRVYADVGDDIYYGGSGIDTLDFSRIHWNNDYAGVVNIAGVTVDLAAEGRSQNLGVYGIDRFFGFENANGSYGNDTIYGTSAANFLDGYAGNDILDGRDGDDFLVGDYGADTLIGGTGGDELWVNDFMEGDWAQDIIRYRALNESGLTGSTSTTPATWDRLFNFVSGQDKIDLSEIDANTKLAGDQAFTLVDNFTRTAGEARLIYNEVGNTFVEIDGNGDAVVDMRILVVTAHLTRADLIL